VKINSELATYKRCRSSRAGEGVWIYASDGERDLDLYLAVCGRRHVIVILRVKAIKDQRTSYSSMRILCTQKDARLRGKLVSIAPNR